MFRYSQMIENIYSRQMIERIRQQYPKGCTVKLIKMDDPQSPPKGTLGKVLFVDDMGTIHIQWETGSTLGRFMTQIL